jgi:hypothetical protein
MAVRKSALDVAVFTLGGTSFLGDTKSWDFQVDVTDDDCRVATDRYHVSVPVKKKLEFTIERIPHVTGVCQSNLSISVYTVGGTSYIGSLESGSISITTDTEDGSGAADLWEFPNTTGTDVEVQTNNFVTSNADLFQLAMANNITAIQVDVVLNLGAVTVSLPMTMTSASHRIEEGQLQMQNVTFKLQGEPNSASGDAVVLEILTGDAYVSWVCDTDAGEYSGNAIITQTSLNFNQAQLQSAQHTLANQGAPSFVAA